MAPAQALAKAIKWRNPMRYVQESLFDAAKYLDPRSSALAFIRPSKSIEAVSEQLSLPLTKTLYRGEHVIPGQPHYLRDWRPTSTPGRWFTSSRTQAESFAHMSAEKGGRGRIRAVEAPFDLEPTSVLGGDETYLLPRNMANNARTLKYLPQRREDVFLYSAWKGISNSPKGHKREYEIFINPEAVRTFRRMSSGRTGKVNTRSESVRRLGELPARLSLRG